MNATEKQTSYHDGQCTLEPSRTPAKLGVPGRLSDRQRRGRTTREMASFDHGWGRDMAAGVGEGDHDLADGAAGATFNPRDGQDDGGGPAADGQGAEAALVGRYLPAGDMVVRVHLRMSQVRLSTAKANVRPSLPGRSHADD